MHKIACVFSFRESSWVSCQKIVFNLHKAYEGVKGDYQISNFDFGEEARNTDIIRLVTDLEEASPDTIVVLDHKPHPIHFLKPYLMRLQSKQKPRIIFHVFGDFTLYYKDWQDLAKLLKDVPVEFIVASDRQKILIDKFLESPHVSKVCPFPVRTEDFSFRPEERKAQRKEWGVEDDEVIFTFTGRISRQKRTHLLLRSFSAALEKEKDLKARLYIYGLPDHVADNFLNRWENENEYFRRVYRQYLELPEHARSRIHFMGNVPNSELRQVYAGSDYLVNLSVHNDEDYGMSVAEAQMTGLPAVLTDWGGLASFEQPALPDATRFIRVRIGKHAKLISHEETVNALCDAMKSRGAVSREKLTELSRKKFSVAAATKIIADILDSKAPVFEKLSDFHALITKRMIFRKAVYLTREQTIHPLYRKIYSSYVRNS